MKQCFLFLALWAAATAVCAQDYSGYRAGNYTGVNGVFFNPASIADSRYQLDINLISANATVGNNKASFNLKDVFHSFNFDSLKQQVIGRNAGASSGLISADIHGLSILFSTGRKMSFALTSRLRVMSNIKDLDGKLADKLINDANNADPTLPYTIASNNNMRLNVHAWSELGLSVARVIKDSGAHFFKAGASFKYLAGAGNAYATVGNLHSTIDEDAAGNTYLTNTTGHLALGFGGINLFDDLEAGELVKMISKGFGADVGFVYEYRPESEKYALGGESTFRRDVNKYKFKVGVALLDLGSLKYKRDMQRSAGYTAAISGTDTLQLSELQDAELNDFKSFFANRPQYFTPDNSNNASTYKASLPTTLQVNIDYHLHRGFYVDLASQLALSKNNNSKPYNSSYYSSVTLTPRYEGRKIGLYIPINYNELTKFNAGAALRMGPLFVGSGSALTALLGDSKQADVYFGLRFGLLQHNVSKELRKAERKEEKKKRREEKAASEATDKTKTDAPQQNQ